VALLGSVALAATLPPPHVPNLAPRQAAGTPSVEVQQLVAGLGFNIMAQKGEQAVASIMQSLLQTPTPDPALFTVAKVSFTFSKVNNANFSVGRFVKFYECWHENTSEQPTAI
jgi:hypothetical protein